MKLKSIVAAAPSAVRKSIMNNNKAEVKNDDNNKNVPATTTNDDDNNIDKEGSSVTGGGSIDNDHDDDYPNNDKAQREIEERNALLAHNETKALRRIRFVLYSIIVITCIIAIVTISIYIQKSTRSTTDNNSSTNDEKNDNNDNDGTVFAFVFGSIFVLTSIVFIIYDRLVVKRQQVLLNRAAATGAIISELYPKNVRDRLFFDANNNNNNNNNNNINDSSARGVKNHNINIMEMENDVSNNNNELISSTLPGVVAGKGRGGALLDTVDECANMPAIEADLSSSSNLDFGGETTVNAASPIADYYENTTILFADLAGFTKWSSTKTPDEVFILLETLYQAFDKIALKRKVFKVETIGDCYVAVTGLPEPQHDHAVIMCLFANDCQNKMKDLIHSLYVDTFYNDDSICRLAFRVGMHSGPITGGVLRGQKSRFQLFGDTINTASRMESNGIRNMIHISQSTANKLISANKSHWVTPREDKIIAKGKGQMDTYFVTITDDITQGLNAITTNNKNNYYQLQSSNNLCFFNDSNNDFSFASLFHSWATTTTSKEITNDTNNNNPNVAQVNKSNNNNNNNNEEKQKTKQDQEQQSQQQVIVDVSHRQPSNNKKKWEWNKRRNSQ